jgi:hypothetical protein
MTKFKRTFKRLLLSSTILINPLMAACVNIESTAEPTVESLIAQQLITDYISFIENNLAIEENKEIDIFRND